jgi:hypothetical protein
MISSSCKNLSYLSLVSAAGIITDESLLNISKNCIKLRHLVMKSSNAEYFTPRGLFAVAGGFNGSLRTFGLVYCPASIHQRSQASYKDVSKSIQEILRQHKSLESFILDWPCHMNSIIECAATNLCTLTSISIANVTDSEIVKRLMQRNSGLKCIKFDEVECRDTSIFHIEALQHHVESIEFTGTAPYGDFIISMSCFTNLTSLIFTPSIRSAFVSGSASDEQMEMLAKNCLCLEVLHIPIHSDSALLSLSKHSSKLTSLTIVGGQLISNQGIIVLVSKCKHLAHLNLGHSSRLTDTAIDYICKTTGSQLCTLGLPIGALLSNESLVSITNCRNLQVLASAPFTFEAMLKYLPSLEYLHTLSLHSDTFYRCQLSRDEIGQLKKSCKRLKLISNI